MDGWRERWALVDGGSGALVDGEKGALVDGGRGTLVDGGGWMERERAPTGSPGGLCPLEGEGQVVVAVVVVGYWLSSRDASIWP